MQTNSALLTLDQLLQGTNVTAAKGVPEVIELDLTQTRQLLSLMPETANLEPAAPILAYLYLGLSKRKLNANTLLGVSLEHLESIQDLIPLGLALRFGADPNGSWELPQGRYSIAIVAALLFRSQRVARNVAMTAWALLLASGLKITAPARPEGLGETRTNVEFLANNRVITPDLERLFQDPSLSQLPDSARNYVGILLNRAPMVRSMDEADQLFVVATFADSLYARISIEHSVDALKFFNNDYLAIALQNGAELRYASVNELLIDMRQRVKLQEMALAQVRLEQLLTAVKYGTVIDKYQYAFLLATLSDKAQSVSAAYREPRWKKECRSASPPSRDLERLALGLQIEQGNKTEVCQLLNQYSTADKDKLVAAAKERRANNLISSGNLLSNTAKTCTNSAQLTKDPLELPKLATVSYISAGKLYCIPSELYESVLKTGLSPFTNDQGIHEQLPISIKTEIEQNLAQLKRYHFSPVAVPSFREMLAQLNDPDNIGLDTSTLQEFYDLAAANGLTRDQIATVSVDSMERALATLDLSTPLAPLDSQEHRIMTLAEEAVPVLENDPVAASRFFLALK